jgi:hypothetical protein
VEDNWRVEFKTTFRVEDMQEWENLMSFLKNFRLNEEED